MESEKHELNWLLAAGIVGADIGTSIFYGTGILFPIVGYLAPVFVLTACLAMWIFKRTYEEGLALSPYNGGAYSMILRGTGKRAAVFAGALTFVSYLATASVSSLAGGFYLSSIFTMSQRAVVIISFVPVIFFGALNIKGIREPAKIVTGIAIFHFFLLICMTIFGLFYVAFNWHDISFEKFTHFTASNQKISFAMLLYGFSAAFLGITGFESAAQIVETLEQPVLLTVRRLYKAVILLVSITAPAISFLALLILTPEEANSNLNYLLSGLALKLGGKILLVILVVDATLTLFAATNTAFVGFIGLATTMAKHGNLPQVLLQKVNHRFPKITGYPVIVIPLIFIVMLISSLVAGEINLAAKVYEIAFLGVMVSFAIGSILLQNKGIRKSTPKEYLSKVHFHINNKKISAPALATALILGIAVISLFVHAKTEALFMLMFLLTGTLILMAYYRWGVLEERLETHTDLRLGLGHFSHGMESLPTELPKYILCVGAYRTRRLITDTIAYITKSESRPFELILFYAEDEDPGLSGLFYEVLQRTVSQQIAPLHDNKDIILTVKILPGSLVEGLQTIKKSTNFEHIYFGLGRDAKHSFELQEHIEKELEISITCIY